MVAHARRASKRVRELQDEIADEDLNISTRRVLAEYSRPSPSQTCADLFERRRHAQGARPSGMTTSRLPCESIDTQETRLRGDDGKYDRASTSSCARYARHEQTLSALEFLATLQEDRGRASGSRSRAPTASRSPARCPVIQFVERADTD
jgi:hypothetical protein